MDILLTNATLYTGCEDNPVVQNGVLGIAGRTIAYVGTQRPEGEHRRVIDCGGGIVMPGLVNTHTHLPMVLLRGYRDDCALQEWLFDHIFPVEDKLDARCVEIGTQLAVAEAMAGGTVSVTDMYMFPDTSAQVIADTGLKANLCRPLQDFDAGAYRAENDIKLQELAELHKQFHGYDEGRIRIDAAVHAEYTSHPAVWCAAADFARANGTGMHVHLSETKREHDECLQKYGQTPAALFAEAGLFDVRTTAAHCVWLSDGDMDLLARYGVTVAHCPVSNLKLASGTARVRDLQAKGVQVTLGTDGAASNNTHDLFEEIKWCALLHKQDDPAAMPARAVLHMATRAGALSQGRTNMGLLRKGFSADLIVLSAREPHRQPSFGADSQLCYATRGSDVRLTMVDGRVVYENGAFLTLDYEKVLHELKSYALPKLGIG